MGGGKKPNKQSSTIFTALPSRALSGMGAHRKIRAACLQMPRCGITRASSKQGSPQWTAPSSPGPADSHTHSPQPQHTTPSLLHKAAACHSPCWCCCQLHCDSPIGHITHYIITRTDLANANTVLCGRMTLGKKTGKYNKQRFSPRKYLETTIQGRDARTSLVNSNIAADLDWEKCLFRNAIYTWTKGLIS